MEHGRAEANAAPTWCDRSWFFMTATEAPLGLILRKGHPAGQPVALTQDQIVDLSHFLHQQVGDTLRTGPYNNVLNILVGDPRAGKAFFNGAGKCSHCHSPTGDLAHIASKYDPPSLQLKVVFPQNRAVARTGTLRPRANR